MSQTPPHEMKFVKVKRKTCLLQKKIAIACGFKLYCKHYFEYSPFDPLFIAGQSMNFIVNSTENDPFKANHFTFVVRWINPVLKENDIKNRILSSFLEDVHTIENSKVNGFMK